MSQMAWYDGPPGAEGAPEARPREEPVRIDLQPVKKKERPPDWKGRFVTPKNIFVGAGTVLLLMLAMMPIWNSIILLQDSNYVFWAGRAVPNGIIISCVLIILFYASTVGCFLQPDKNKEAVPIEQTIMMIANIYITLFGLFLMVVSLPLTHQAQLTYTNLIHRCEFSEQTHRLFEYSQVLQNIRATPECAKLNSVEECEGYEPAAPYTNFLKGMEHNFRCTGFCYQPPPAAAAAGPAAAPAAAPGPAPASLISTKRHLRTEQVALATDGSTMAANSTASHQPWTTPVYPPTLFSEMNFQASCEGVAARDMKNFAGDIAQQTFMQGIYLVLIAVFAGFLKLINFCMPKNA